MPDPSRPPDRVPGLDVLRGLAALAVLGFHYTTRFGAVFGHPTALSFSVPWGQRGVELFFVISGFVIALSVESTSGARDFVVSRAVRLYPTFWAALAVTFTVVGIFGLPERATSLHDAVLNLSMIPVSLGAEAVDAVYWTLERELRFYGLVVVLLVLGIRRYTVHALLLTVVVQAVDATWRCVPHPVADLLNAHWAHLFACGALLFRGRSDPSWKTYGLLSACLASSLLFGTLPFFYGTAAVGLVWISTRPFAHARMRPLIFLGKISYPLYLVHQYVGYVLMRALYARGAPPSLAIASACAVAFAIATALHFAVEEPCQARLRRWRPKARAPGVPAALRG